MTTVLRVLFACAALFSLCACGLSEGKPPCTNSEPVPCAGRGGATWTDLFVAGGSGIFNDCSNMLCEEDLNLVIEKEIVGEMSQPDAGYVHSGVYTTHCSGCISIIIFSPSRNSSFHV